MSLGPIGEGYAQTTSFDQRTGHGPTSLIEDTAEGLTRDAHGLGCRLLIKPLVVREAHSLPPISAQRDRRSGLGRRFGWGEGCAGWQGTETTRTRRAGHAPHNGRLIITARETERPLSSTYE